MSKSNSKYKPETVLKKWGALCAKVKKDKTKRKAPGRKIAREYAAKAGMRSMFEVQIATQLPKYEYEKDVIPYQCAAQKYRPDFKVNGIYIEAKGKMTNDTRKKMKSIIASNPSKIFVMLFMRGANYIRSGSKTTYLDWAEKESILAFDISQMDDLLDYLKRNKGKEKWKLVKEFPTYLVSNEGRLLRRKAGKTMAFSNCGTGYVMWHLRYNSKKRDVQVHTLVAEHFIGTKPEACEINHKDGNKKNNKVTNLEWVTKSKNHIHAMKTGLNKPPPPMVGEKHARAKLSEIDVLKIRDIYAETKCSQADLAREYGVKNQTINSIIKRRLWKHI